jgi:glutamate receptor, ionotropic, plant
MGAVRLMSLFLVVLAAASAAGARPREVAVGALFTYDSTIGRAARLAIELAVDDVNADRTVLVGSTLKLITQDTNCSGFLGTINGSLLASSSPQLLASMSHELELPY